MRHVNVDLLSEVCQSVRKYTRKRMHFVSYLPLFKIDYSTNLVTVMLAVVDASSEIQTLTELTKQGYSLAKIIRKPVNNMLCEGEISRLQIQDDKKTSVAVAYFDKQLSRRTAVIEAPRRQVVKFLVTNETGSATLVEGEIFV